MTAPEYAFEERSATEMPAPTHNMAQEALGRLFEAASRAQGGRAIFVKVPGTGATRDVVTQLRDRIAKACRRRHEPYTVVSDHERGGVWLRRNAATSEDSSGVRAENAHTDERDLESNPDSNSLKEEPIKQTDAGLPPVAASEVAASLFPEIDKAPEPAAVSVCFCPSWWRLDTRHWQPDVANEGHHDSCPMYRKGAHRWDIPAVSDGNGGYAGRCIWCGQTREHRPYDEPDTKAQTLPPIAPVTSPDDGRKRSGAGICSECGNGYASKVHRAHRQAVSR